MKDLILLHGALGSQSLFGPLKNELTNDYELYSFNLSGHGQTPFNTSGFGIEVFAEELNNFIQSRHLVKPLIFGYSMGGYVALYLEAINPGSFAQIMTLGTKFGWNPEASRKEASRLKPDIIEQKAPAFAQILAARHGDQWKDLMEATAEMMLNLGNQPLLNSSTLATIQTRVTIMRGDQDQMVNREESEAAAYNIPDGSYIELQKTPHPIEKVAPAMLAARLKSDR
ncbi:MAG: alpha/beta hydrolase [Roseivirga sp.]|nr:alpha/beta hydrolase [Roseivirga sp.]